MRFPYAFRTGYFRYGLQSRFSLKNRMDARSSWWAVLGSNQ